ncbi:MAG: hypothetical protein AAGG08_02425, partial [Actinomycetota bacterium]
PVDALHGAPSTEGGGMNVVDLVESARPEVAPMPLDQRRMVRERLFGAADDVVKTTIRERSASGAVTSTAPPGYRASRVRARPARPRSSGSLAKMGAGLLVVGAAAAAGWSWYDDGSDDELASATPTSVSTTTSTTTTVAVTTTTLAPTRTGVTSAEPVVFPLGLIPVEEAVVDLAPERIQSALLRAGDGTWLRLEAVRGDAADLGPDVTNVGALDIATFTFGPGLPWIYTVETSCGAVRVIDAPAQEQFRPLVTDLFSGVSIDGDGTVDALLPSGVRIVEAAQGIREYRTVFRFDDADSGDADLATLRQVPGGSIAQLVPGGAQPSEMVWLDEPALGVGDLLTSDDDIGPVSVFWRDAGTVFEISSETIPLDELETFVSGLRAVSIESWIDRFSAQQVDTTVTLGAAPADDGDEADGDDPAPECMPQPSLGPTFRP